VFETFSIFETSNGRSALSGWAELLLDAGAPQKENWQCDLIGGPVDTPAGAE
jgi:hypothetical protein